MLERLCGSLFVWELSRDGRRYWPNVVRCLVVLLAAIFLGGAAARVYPHERFQWGEMPRRLATFQETFTLPCLYLTFYACLALTPALFATLLSRDRESRLLDLLLTTQLTRDQVVIGRWGVRLIELAMIILAATPVVILSFAFGGPRLELLIAALVVSLTTATSLSALAILASAMARTSRGAFVLAYAAPIILALAPQTVITLTASLVDAKVAPSEALSAVSAAVDDWNRYASPVSVFGFVVDADDRAWRWDMAPLLSTFVSIHLGATLLALRLAVRALGRDGEAALQRWVQVRRRFERRQNGFGRAPVFQREWRAGPSGLWAVVQRFGFTVGAFLALYLPYYAFVFKPFGKLWRLFGDWRDTDYVLYYLWTGGGLLLLALLQVLHNAGSSIALERDRDTWHTLLSTPLTARAVVLQKTLAAMRPVLTLLAFWIPLSLLFAATGRADNLCVIATCVVPPTLALFVASLAFRLTLQARQPWSGMLTAFGTTVAVIVMLTGMQAAVSPRPEDFDHHYGRFDTVGVTDGLWVLSSPFLLTPFPRQADPRWIVLTFSIAVFGAAAALVTYSIEGFPSLTGRRENADWSRGWSQTRVRRRRQVEIAQASAAS